MVLDLLKNTGKGNEPTLSNMFKNHVLQYSQDREVKAASDLAHAKHDQFVKYRAFDMHHECSKGWDKAADLVKLVDELDLAQMSAGNRTVARTNCLDCLDRTNLAQQLIALEVLRRQLANTDHIEPLADLERVHREVWACNGDLIAKQYTTAGAFKKDVVKTGKRTFCGMWEDLCCVYFPRCFAFNYTDDTKQETIDLLIGALSMHDEPER